MITSSVKSYKSYPFTVETPYTGVFYCVRLIFHVRPFRVRPFRVRPFHVRPFYVRLLFMCVFLCVRLVMHEGGDAQVGRLYGMI